MPKLGQRRPLGGMADLIEEVIGERESLKSRTCLESAMEVVGNVAELDHLGHVSTIAACDRHVTWPSHLGRDQGRVKSDLDTLRMRADHPAATDREPTGLSEEG